MGSNMLGAKPWYRSKGVWGSLIAGVYTLLAVMGMAPTDAVPADVLAEQVVTAIDAGAVLLGSLLAFYGRLVAKDKIRKDDR